MVEYIYFVKCADCEDESFEFFDKAKDYALSCMSKKPVITQIEVNRNDFGECVDSCDLGTVWSWEEAMRDIPQDDTMSFSKADTFDYDNFDTELDDNITFETDCVVNDRALDEAYYAVIEVDGEERRFSFDSREDAREYLSYVRAGKDPAFKGKKLGSMYTESCRKAIPEGMTIEALVEEMEELEDTVECKECYGLYAKQDCTYEEGRGYICHNCQESTDKTDLNEEHKWTDTIELYYPLLTVRLAKVSDVDNYYDPRRVSPPEPDVKEFVYSDEFVYNEFLDNVLLFLAEDCITAEDIKHFGSSIEDLDSIDDGYAYQDFAEKHYDYFYDKYETEILNKFKDNAIRAFGEHCEKEGIGQFLESYETTGVSLVETLEESEDYRQRLTMCPECGDNAFDLETGICINCGLSTLTEDADRPDYLNVSMPDHMIARMQKEVETFIKDSIEKCKKAKANNRYQAIQFKLPAVFGITKNSNKGKTLQYIIDELAKAGFPGGEPTSHDEYILLVPLKDNADLAGLAKSMKDKEDEQMRNFNPNDPISAGRRAAAEFERSPHDASSFRKSLDADRRAAHKAQGDR